MSIRSERIEARVSAVAREQIERAARFEGQSVSAFIVGAAVEKADLVLADHVITVVPPDYFDHLVAALDVPDEAPRLRRVVKRSARRSQIV